MIEDPMTGGVLGGRRGDRVLSMSMWPLRPPPDSHWTPPLATLSGSYGYWSSVISSNMVKKVALILNTTRGNKAATMETLTVK